MADADLAHQSTLTFNGTTYTVTSVSVEAPTPEIANLTGFNTPVGKFGLAKTGDYTAPGRISIEGFGFDDPKAFVDNDPADAVFATPKGTITRRCFVQSASVTGRVGDVLRISVTLTPTDYTG